MDAQLKRGLLEACVLAVLQRGDSYGYQIVRDLETQIAISESTLYPILRRLEAGAFLQVYTVEHNGRLRKYYRITPEGQKRLVQFLQEGREVLALYRFVAEEAKTDEQTGIS